MQVVDGVLIQNRHRNSVDKHDADLLANYSINRWMKLVFGLKYQGYMIEDKIRSIYSTAKSFVIPSSDNIRFHSGGGGLGLGFTIPLGANFYIFPGFSGIPSCRQGLCQA